MLRKIVKYLKTSERTEAKKEFEETLEVVELAEVEVSEEEVEWWTERHTFRNREAKKESEQVRQGREEEMNYRVKTLGMFEFGSWEEATLKAGKALTTTTWMDHMKKTMMVVNS